MAENPRIEELRRRVQKDPASIAFAQLAEELRRVGSFDQAIATCNSGLAIHPGYLSARVTLGRALIEVNDLAAAEVELNQVLQHAPENLAAVRGLAEIHRRQGNLKDALRFYRTALTLARHDPDLEQTVDQIERTLTPERPPVEDGLTFEQATAEFLLAAEQLPSDLAPAAAVSPSALALSGLEQFLEAIHAYRQRMPAVPVGILSDPVLPELERFLEAIHTYRQRKAL